MLEDWGACNPNETCGMSCTKVDDYWEFVMIVMPASVHKGHIVR